jgi:hypothetical protein
MVVAHLLVNIVHGLAHGELRVGLAPVASIFVIVVVLVFPLIAMGLLLDSQETTRRHSSVAFDVRIIAIRFVSPFPGCELRSHLLAAFGWMGLHV